MFGAISLGLILLNGGAIIIGTVAYIVAELRR